VVCPEWHLGKQAVFEKHVSCHSDEGRNPEKRPPLVDVNPGILRDDRGTNRMPKTRLLHRMIVKQLFSQVIFKFSVF